MGDEEGGRVIGAKGTARQGRINFRIFRCCANAGVVSRATTIDKVAAVFCNAINSFRLGLKCGVFFPTKIWLLITLRKACVINCIEKVIFEGNLLILHHWSSNQSKHLCWHIITKNNTKTVGKAPSLPTMVSHPWVIANLKCWVNVTWVVLLKIREATW